MRYELILILFLVMGCATTLPPAGPSDQAMDKADKIYLTVDDSPDEAYKSFASYLSGEGFAFSNSDEVIRTLSTEYKHYQGSSSFQYKVNANIRDDSMTVIQISGKGVMLYLGEMEAENRGSSGSPVQNLWQEIETLAKEYPHRNIYYGRN